MNSIPNKPWLKRNWAEGKCACGRYSFVADEGVSFDQAFVEAALEALNAGRWNKKNGRIYFSSYPESYGHLLPHEPGMALLVLNTVIVGMVIRN